MTAEFGIIHSSRAGAGGNSQSEVAVVSDNIKGVGIFRSDVW